MGPTKREILIEDLTLVNTRLDFLQQTVSANDIWQNKLLWEHVKIMKDILKKEKREILIEDLTLVNSRLDFLQQTVSANDIWQNKLLWEHTKILKDILEKEIG